MTDGHFVGLEGNADSLQLPTVDVLVRQQNKKKIGLSNQRKYNGSSSRRLQSRRIQKTKIICCTGKVTERIPMPFRKRNR